MTIDVHFKLNMSDWPNFFMLVGPNVECLRKCMPSDRLRYGHCLILLREMSVERILFKVFSWPQPAVNKIKESVGPSGVSGEDFSRSCMRDELCRCSLLTSACIVMSGLFGSFVK